LPVDSNSPIGYSDLEINHNLFTNEEYLAVVVHVNEEDENQTDSKSRNGLVVKQVAGIEKGEKYVYERVGMFQFDEFKFSWLEHFEWQILTLA
jgi:hypothetical protein